MRKLVSLLMMSVLTSLSEAAIESYRWPILSSGNEVFIAGELFRDSQYRGRELDLNLSSNKGELATLGFYYKSAIKQNRAALERLHYLNDGSRSRFAREMQKTPDRYAGFVKLEQVKVGDLYYWGDYVLSEVEWFGGGKRLAGWREGLACDEYCFVTDRFLNTTPAVDAYSAGLYSFAKKAGNGSVDNIRKRNRLKNELVYLPDVGGRDHPFTLWFKVNDYPRKVILARAEALEAISKSKKVSRADHQIVFDFISAVWKDTESVDGLLRDSGAEAAQQQVNNLYGKFWRDYNPQLLLPMYDFSYAEETPRASVALFSPYALFQRISSWESVRPLGYMQSEDSTYLLLKAINKLDQEELQVFYVQKDSRGTKQLTADLREIDVQNIVKTPQFGNKLVSLYLAKEKAQ